MTSIGHATSLALVTQMAVLQQCRGEFHHTEIPTCGLASFARACIIRFHLSNSSSSLAVFYLDCIAAVSKSGFLTPIGQPVRVELRKSSQSRRKHHGTSGDQKVGRGRGLMRMRLPLCHGRHGSLPLPTLIDRLMQLLGFQRCRQEHSGSIQLSCGPCIKKWKYGTSIM